MSVEIGKREREIQDLILKLTSPRRRLRTSAPAHYDELQAELMDAINTIMTTAR